MTESGLPPNPFAAPDPGSPPPPPPAPWGSPPPYGQQPPPYGWAPHPQAQRPRTSGLAVAALVTSILGLVPVALGLSIAALVRMKSQAQKGLGLVIGALSVCGAWAALATLFVVVGVLGGWDYKSIGSISEVASAEVGTCLNADPPSVEDCASSHDLEVFFAPTLPDPVWPGTGDVASEADALCEEAFEPYVGTSYSSSDLDYEFYAPTEAEWAAGKHKVVCVITLSGDDLVGSVHGSGN